MMSAKPYVCPYCHTASDGGVSCPECGAPLNTAGSLRVSDGDRDQIVAELTDHFQAGRLTKEEFDSRTGQALQARTRAELVGVLSDLPPAQASPAAEPGRRRNTFTGEIPADGVGSRFPVGKAGTGIGIGAVVVIVVIVALVIAGLHGNHGSLSGLIPVIAIVAFVLRRSATRDGRRHNGGILGRDDRYDRGIIDRGRDDRRPRRRDDDWY
jgi:hypothetical protein